MTDWLTRYPASMQPTIQRLLGCSWGRSIWSKEDPSLCSERAVQPMMLYRDGEPTRVQLCERHAAVIKDPEISSPHDFGAEHG